MYYNDNLPREQLQRFFAALQTSRKSQLDDTR